jgi:hypothetical protein
MLKNADKYGSLDAITSKPKGNFINALYCWIITPGLDGTPSLMRISGFGVVPVRPKGSSPVGDGWREARSRIVPVMLIVFPWIMVSR